MPEKNSSLALISTNFFLTQTQHNTFQLVFFCVFLLLLMVNKTEHRVLHLLDPGIFQCTTVRYVPAQKSVPLQLMWLLCYSSHCQRPANNKWSQHSAHKSHLNIGRVKWIHPFSLPTSFNWCLWVELNTGCCRCRCSSFSAFFVGTCDNLTDHSTPIVPGILMIFLLKATLTQF